MRRASLLIVPFFAACGGAPTLADLGPTERAPICRSFAEEPKTGYGCRAEDIPGLINGKTFQATVEFRADGRMKRFTGLTEKRRKLTDVTADPPRCVDDELKLLRTDPPRAVVVPIELTYRGGKAATRTSGLRGPFCAIDIGFVAQ